MCMEPLLSGSSIKKGWDYKMKENEKIIIEAIEGILIGTSIGFLLLIMTGVIMLFI